MTWPRYRIKDICDLERGTSPTLRTEPGPYPLVVTADFRRTSGTWQFDVPTVCVPLISSTGHGDAALHRVHYQTGKHAVANLLVALTNKAPELLEMRYLYLLLMAQKDRLLVPLMLGTANVSLKEKDVAGVEIPLPPLREQRRVVERIDALASKLSAVTRLSTESATEIMAYRNSFMSRLFRSLPSAKSEQLSTLGTTGANPIQTGPFGAQLHADEFVESGVPVLNVGNVWPEGLRLARIDHVTPQKAEMLQRYSLLREDLLFARSGATLGKVCLVPSQCDGWLMTGHLFRVRLDQSRCRPHFAFLGLQYVDSIRSQIFQQVRGATRPGFNTSLLSKVHLPIPPLSIQDEVIHRFQEMERRLRSVIQLKSETAKRLSALRPSILDRAFRGEL